MAVNLALALALALTSSATGPTPVKTYDEWLRAGIAEQSAGNREKAAADLETALRIDPNGYDALIHLAHLYFLLGRVEEGARLYRQARNEHPKLMESYIEEGYSWLRVGDDSRAEASFEKIIQRDPSNGKGYHHVGAFFFMRGQNAAAQRCFEEALRRFDKDPRAAPNDIADSLQYLGTTLLNQGRLREAGAIYDRGLRVSGQASGRDEWRAIFMDRLARIQSAEHRPDLAESLLDRAQAACSPQDSCPRWTRIDLLVDLCNVSTDLHPKSNIDSLIARILTVDRSGLVLERIGRICAQRGESAKAEDFYRRAISACSVGPCGDHAAGAQTGLAALLAGQGRLDEARGLYERAIREWRRQHLPGDEVEALTALSGILERQGLVTQAQALRKRSRALVSSSSIPNPCVSAEHR